jgi:hypothetical protein
MLPCTFISELLIICRLLSLRPHMYHRQSSHLKYTPRIADDGSVAFNSYVLSFVSERFYRVQS